MARFDDKKDHGTKTPTMKVMIEWEKHDRIFEKSACLLGHPLRGAKNGKKKERRLSFAPHLAQIVPCGREKNGKKTEPFFFFLFGTKNGWFSFGQKKTKKEQTAPQTMEIYDNIIAFLLAQDVISFRTVEERMWTAVASKMMCQRNAEISSCASVPDQKCEESNMVEDVWRRQVQWSNP